MYRRSLPESDYAGKGDGGQALVAGLCIAFIAIIADLVIRSWSESRKKQLGIE